MEGAQGAASGLSVHARAPIPPHARAPGAQCAFHHIFHQYIFLGLCRSFFSAGQQLYPSMASWSSAARAASSATAARMAPGRRMLRAALGAARPRMMMMSSA